MEKAQREDCLIHCITNPISINQVANTILALGARPVMVEHPAEAEEITSTASSLLLNLGNITDVRMQSMKISLKTANDKGIPVTLDVCGAACSTLRKRFIRELLSSGTITVIKGNYSEILALTDDTYSASGVDAADNTDEDRIKSAVLSLAENTGAIVVATGRVDLVGSEGSITEVTGGSDQLSSVTGTGCMSGAVIATYLAREVSVGSVISACRYFKKCGEEAETNEGPGTFMVDLMDCLAFPKPVLDTTLYFITDSTGFEEDEFLDRVNAALAGGVTLLQLREKTRTAGEYIDLARKVHKISSKFGVPLIIDDRVDVMLAAGCEGVHVGAEDMPVAQARKLIGKRKILGATAKTVEAAQKAYADGADYLGVGAIYPTTTKVKTVLTPVSTLDAITKAVPIPVNAIGGLNSGNIDILKNINISGVCAVSAIMKADSPELAARELKQAFLELRRNS